MKTKYMKRHLIIIALFAILLPGALLAQDELTLESLQELITALDTRLSAIEAQFADPWSPDKVTDDDVCQSPLHGPPADNPFINRMIDTIHQETADAYRAEYGVSVDPTDADLISISFSVDGSDIHLEYMLSKKKVVETWANCEYLGHSKWTE